jgi:hypothetical protein
MQIYMQYLNALGVASPHFEDIEVTASATVGTVEYSVVVFQEDS